MAKRRGEHERAVGIWEEMVLNSQDGVHACEQLAIYYERRVKDAQRAIQYAKLGLAKLRRERVSSQRGSSDPHLAARFAQQEKGFNARLARLERKERKAPPSSPAPQRDAPAAAEPKASPKLW